MRHRVHGRKLGRTSAHRKALFRNQLTALFTHDRIITTVAKAKELRPVAERMVTIARTGTLAARRRVATMVQDKEVAQRLFEEIAPRFADRPGGYTRIMRLGRRRGDNAELAIIEFVDYELAEHQEGGDKDRGKGSLLDRAKGVFGGKPAADAAEATEVEAAADDLVESVDETPAEAASEEPEEVIEAADTEAEAPTEADDEGAAAKAADEPVEAAEEEPVKEAAADQEDAEPAADAEPAETEDAEETEKKTD
jgi:large subunit ribosomal protein L17